MSFTLKIVDKFEDIKVFFFVSLIIKDENYTCEMLIIQIHDS